MLTTIDLCNILGAGRFDLSDEKVCQAEIEIWLRDRLPPSVEWSREVRLGPGDVPDFLVDHIAVEVKMNSAQPRAVVRQLARYARHQAVGSLILLSNRAIALPRTLEGKPVFNVSLGKAWL